MLGDAYCPAIHVPTRRASQRNIRYLVSEPHILISTADWKEMQMSGLHVTWRRGLDAAAVCASVPWWLHSVALDRSPFVSLQRRAPRARLRRLAVVG